MAMTNGTIMNAHHTVNAINAMAAASEMSQSFI